MLRGATRGIATNKRTQRARSVPHPYLARVFLMQGLVQTDRIPITRSRMNRAFPLVLVMRTRPAQMLLHGTGIADLLLAGAVLGDGAAQVSLQGVSASVVALEGAPAELLVVAVLGLDGAARAGGRVVDGGGTTGHLHGGAGVAVDVDLLAGFAVPDMQRRLREMQSVMYMLWPRVMRMVIVKQILNIKFFVVQSADIPVDQLFQ